MIIVTRAEVAAEAVALADAAVAVVSAARGVQAVYVVWVALNNIVSFSALEVFYNDAAVVQEHVAALVEVVEAVHTIPRLPCLKSHLI